MSAVTRTAIRACVLGLPLLGASLAFAQDFNKVAPQAPPRQQPGTIAQPDIGKPIVPPATNTLLLPELKGLRFVAGIGDIVRTGAKGAGIDVAPALTLLEDPAVKARLAAFLGKPLHADDLPRISETILDWYRSHNMPAIDVAFPEQQIDNGVIQAVVTVYRLNKVNVAGNRWFSSDLLRGQLKSKAGEPINIDTLAEDLNRLNGNPFRRVNAVLAHSDVVGSTDINLNVEDRLPLRVYASLDNDGLPATSRYQYSAGFSYGNVFGLDHQASYRFITSPDLWQTRNRGAGHSNDTRFMAHSATYLAPLPWGDTLSLFGTYVTQVPNLGSDFDQLGHSLQMSARYEKRLPSFANLTQQIQVGFDFKRSDNNLSFGGTGIFASATNVEQFLAIYDGTLRDSYGQTAVENMIVASPGGLSPGNTTAIFVASGVAGAKADYIYDNLQITRVTSLPWGISSVARFVGQLASTELLPSEQLGAGGTDSVRGYDPRTANGSQGALFSMEFRSPAYSPLRALGTGIGDAMQLLAFYDAGFVSNLNAQTGISRSASLQSAGLGARYSIDRFIDVRLDYGWQLAKAPGAASLGSLFGISVTAAY